MNGNPRILPEEIGISQMKFNGNRYLVDHRRDTGPSSGGTAMYVKDRWLIIVGEGLMMSVVRGLGSYGYSKGLFEIAFLDTENSCFSRIFQSEWLDDVPGYLTEDEVLEWLLKAEEL